MIEKIQKGLIITSIVTVSIVVIMLISALFGAEIFNNKTLTAILLTIAAISAVGFFINSALDMFNKKKIIAIISMVLLGFAFIFGLVNFWTHFEMEGIFPKISGIIAIASVLFVIIITTNAKLDNNFKVLQFVTYGLIIALDIILTLVILGVDLFGTEGFSEFFWAFCFIVFALLCINNIVGKRITSNNLGKDYIKVSVKEYNELKERINQLEKENKELRG